MIDFKKEIAGYIARVTNLKQEELQDYIEKPKDIKNGDYAFPCFRLAKQLKKSPNLTKKTIDFFYRNR